MTLSLIDAPSPNFNDRPGCAPSFIILHYTDMETGVAALAHLRDSATKVSAHYLIEEDGRIFSLVPEGKRAWHAGESWWGGLTDLNGHSIGIELVNPGHSCGYRAFPLQQMQALVELIRDIRTRHDIPNDNILGHSDIAPHRKRDPGEFFDWQILAARGIGLWPDPQPDDDAETELCLRDEDRLRTLFAACGYDTRQDMVAVITAFQRHYHPRRFLRADRIGQADQETIRLLAALVRFKKNRKA